MDADGAVIRIVTRCSSADDFIDRFAHFTTESDVVVPALPHVSAGTAGHFVICLEDGTVMLKGRCELAAHDGATAPSEPALTSLRFREMDARSSGIHLRLMERRASTAERPATDVSALVKLDDEPPADTETTAVSPLPGTEARVPPVALTLPANPLSDVSTSYLANLVDENLLASNTRAGALVDRRRRLRRRAVLGASAMIFGLAVGMALKPRSKVASVAAAPVIARAIPPARPPAAPATPPVELPDPTPRACVARVTTKPGGVTVSWGDIVLGSTPIQHAAVPCGPATVTFRRERWAEATRTVVAEYGQSAVVSQRLERPLAKLTVTSSPPNAVIKVNKHRLGRTPSEITTPRFERLRIEASLPGYRPWKKTSYLQDAESTVEIKLVRSRGPSAHRAKTASSSASPPSRRQLL